ncbi:MAG TPA: aminoacyl-tRNA hydrolase [Bacteroidales bacterium]|nr:aminoacyl-tRNA hydrolase [Bacteroidales bacterium]HPI67996.1 aminoacyl-tRNA hydrolase [Bacteroidales bacterium]HPR72441.1 aminoacyl-tRNA hydrolase [Bacteroidales bacterium]
MKYLIIGLGNIGDEYSDTRHNIGFTVLDTFALSFHASFEDKRYGFICRVKHKGRDLILLKPSTYMNLSGNAVRYWLNREKIAIENLLVIVDDLALPLGSIRMRRKGNDGGHNGLAHINSVLSTNEYARIRIGIGNEYSKGRQVEYVLGRWTSEEKKFLEERIALVTEMIKSFCTAGTEITMTTFNKAGKTTPKNTTRENSDNTAPQ